MRRKDRELKTIEVPFDTQKKSDDLSMLWDIALNFSLTLTSFATLSSDFFPIFFKFFFLNFASNNWTVFNICAELKIFDLWIQMIDVKCVEVTKNPLKPYNCFYSKQWRKQSTCLSIAFPNNSKQCICDGHFALFNVMCLIQYSWTGVNWILICASILL